MTITATSDSQILKSNIRNWAIGLQTFATGSLPRSGLVQRALWNIDSGSASLRLDVGSPDHLAPLLGFLRNEFPEIGGPARKHSATKVGKAPPHCRIGEASINLLVELVDDPGRCPCRCAEAEIAARLIARHEFADGRKVRQRVRARGRAHRKRAQPARPDVLDQGRHGVETDLHLASLIRAAC